MSDPRDVVNDRFAETFEEPSDVPAMPSRPASEPRIAGVAAEVWASGIERKLDALARAQVDALHESAQNLRALAGEIRDGFARIGEVLKTQEQHGREIRDLRTDVNKLERDVAANSKEIEKLRKSATARLKGKR